MYRLAKLEVASIYSEGEEEPRKLRDKGARFSAGVLTILFRRIQHTGETEEPSMRKVLVITSTYPTTGGSRTERFLKYLQEFGYRPVVLTTRGGIEHLQQPNPIKTYRAFSMKRTPFRILSRYFKLEDAKDYLEAFFFIPDLGITWVPDAIIKGLRILKDENIDLIFSTSPPESTHIIGSMLSRLSGKKWIADFRDLWTQKKIVAYRPPTIFHHKIAKRLEQDFLLGADHVIAVTEEIKEIYLNSFPLDEKRITVITNGYDPEDSKSINLQAPLNTGRLNIGYMGTFDKRGFPWREFLIGLSQLINVKPGAKVHVNICGEPPSSHVLEFIRNQGLMSYITYWGKFSHSDAFGLTAKNDLLLLLLYDTDFSAGTATSKLYNYLIMQKPVFAISPETGAAARIIRGTNTGKVVSPSDAEGILQALVQYYEIWSGKGKLEVLSNAEEVRKYDGKILTRKLATVFDKAGCVCCDRRRVLE